MILIQECQREGASKRVDSLELFRYRLGRKKINGE